MEKRIWCESVDFQYVIEHRPGNDVLEEFECSSWPCPGWQLVAGVATATLRTSAKFSGAKGLIDIIFGWWMLDTFDGFVPGSKVSIFTRALSNPFPKGITQLAFDISSTGTKSFVFSALSSTITSSSIKSHRRRSPIRQASGTAWKWKMLTIRVLSGAFSTPTVWPCLSRCRTRSMSQSHRLKLDLVTHGIMWTWFKVSLMCFGVLSCRED